MYHVLSALGCGLTADSQGKTLDAKNERLEKRHALSRIKTTHFVRIPRRLLCIKRLAKTFLFDVFPWGIKSIKAQF